MPRSQPNITLRPITPADLPTLYAFQCDRASSAMAVATPRDRADFDAHWHKVLNDSAVTVRAIEYTNTLVGEVSCFQVESVHYVGYWIDRSVWGKGIATRAVELLLELVPTRPLHARAARANTGSLRVLERNGFVLDRYEMSEGTARFPACEEAHFVLTS